MASITLQVFKVITTFILLQNGLSSALRVETSPEPYKVEIGGDLNITCRSNGTLYEATQIVMVELLKEGGNPIAFLREHALTSGPGSRADMKIEGHVKKDASSSYLRVTITNPQVQDGGEYTCRMFYQDVFFNLKEEKAHANVTIDSSVTVKASTLRITSNPETFTEMITDQLNITCMSNGTLHQATQVVLVELVKDGGSPIAFLREQSLSKGPGLKANMRAEGHVEKDASQSYLRVTIDNPVAEDAGGYSCQIFYQNSLFQLKEEVAHYNVTVDNANVQAILKYLTGKVSVLEKAVQDQAGVISEQSDKIQDQAKQLEAQKKHVMDRDANDHNTTDALNNLLNQFLNHSHHIQEHKKKDQTIMTTVTYLLDGFSALNQTVNHQKNMIDTQEDKLDQQEMLLRRQNRSLTESKHRLDDQEEHLNQQRNRSDSRDSMMSQDIYQALNTLQTMITDHTHNGTDQDISQAVTSLRDKLVTLNKTVAQQDATIRDQEVKLDRQETLVKKQNDTMTEYESKLGHQQKELEELQKELKNINTSGGSNNAITSSLKKLIDRNTYRLMDIQDTVSQQGQVIKQHNETIAVCKHDINTGSQGGHSGGSLTSAFSVGFDIKNTFNVGDTVKFAKEILNIGQDYDSDTGVYTAPTKGLYVFHLVATTASADWAVEIDLMSNKVKVASLMARNKYHWDQSSISTVLSLKGGDKIKPVVKYENTGNRLVSDDYYSVFTGYLLKSL